MHDTHNHCQREFVGIMHYVLIQYLDTTARTCKLDKLDHMYLFECSKYLVYKLVRIRVSTQI